MLSTSKTRKYGHELFIWSLCFRIRFNVNLSIFNGWFFHIFISNYSRPSRSIRRWSYRKHTHLSLFDTFSSNFKGPDEIGLSIDDKILLHFSPLLAVSSQTYSRNAPIRRITLESNIQVFFDQVRSTSRFLDLIISIDWKKPIDMYGWWIISYTCCIENN